MTEANKAVVRAFYDAINRRDFDALGQYCHEDFIFYHQMNTPHQGVEGFIASEKKNFDAFADWQMPIKELIAEGDKVAAYLVFEGTHVGENQGIAPTGNVTGCPLGIRIRTSRPGSSWPRRESPHHRVAVPVRESASSLVFPTRTMPKEHLAGRCLLYPMTRERRRLPKSGLID
jgi:predicted ester cyclase